MDLFKHYREFVEWSVAQTPRQGQYLISQEKFIKELIFEDNHPDEHYACEVTDGKDNEKKQDIQENTWNISNNENKLPFIVGVCKMQEIPCIELESLEPDEENSSLSSFEFDNYKYASTKVNNIYFVFYF